jgi:hypothetical protein
MQLPEEIVKRYNLVLTDKTVGDSLIYGHVFYRYKEKYLLTNHHFGEDPCYLSKRNLWALSPDDGMMFQWRVVFTTTFLCDANFDILAETIKNRRRCKLINPN